MKMSHKVAGLIGTASLAVVTVLSYYTAIEYFLVVGRDAATGMYPVITPFDFTWLDFGTINGVQLLFTLGFRLTPISVMMLIVISTVSLMVHIYSFGYMHGEKGFQRYYAFLSLFSMSMLGLVVATNIFQMYLFWELVGVSSYLLIGFYYPLQAAVAASKKAFIVTRFADLFFLIGILILSFYTKTFDFKELMAVVRVMTFFPSSSILKRRRIRILPWFLHLATAIYLSALCLTYSPSIVRTLPQRGQTGCTAVSLSSASRTESKVSPSVFSRVFFRVWIRGRGCCG
jgi:NADH:ubiquinone oxidoreductase subunit 5 (subunit L)/multisubunit Na+/H+ antiporter MnhA subunit